MPDDHSTTAFHDWLKPLLDSVAEECGNYVRSAQEGVPADASAVHEVLLESWDAYNIVVRLNKQYDASRELAQFLHLNELAPTATFEQRVELLDRYYEQASEVDPDAAEHVQARAVLMAEVRKVFNGTGTGEMLSDVFRAAFAGDEEDDDDLDDDEPAALVYVYDEAWEARPAYNGEQPPFDRASEVLLLRWNPLTEDEKEILRDIVETQRGADGHLDLHFEKIVEKLAL